MFKLKRSKDVPGYKNPVRVGAPDYTNPDIIITTTFSSVIYQELNSIVLKTALLNSKELLEQYLGLKITEIKPKVKKEVKTKEESPKEILWK
jgi:hypothetical protein